MVPSEFNLEGYNIYCHGLKDKNNTGLLVYVEFYLGANVVDIQMHSMFLVLKLTSTSNRLLLDNICRSPKRSQDNGNNC